MTVKEFYNKCKLYKCENAEIYLPSATDCIQMEHNHIYIDKDKNIITLFVNDDAN